LDVLPGTPIEMWSGTASPTSEKSNACSVDGDRSSTSSVSEQGDGGIPLVAVIGVGYVGEHLVQTFSTHYPVVGFDVSAARVKSLKKQQSRGKSDVTFTSDEVDLKGAQYFLVAVPTLVQESGEIKLDHLKSALATVCRNAQAGSTVVIESSVAVGKTRELLGEIAKTRGFFVGMSPEVCNACTTQPTFSFTLADR